jgi:hypothetical protein
MGQVTTKGEFACLTVAQSHGVLSTGRAGSGAAAEPPLVFPPFRRSSRKKQDSEPG